MPVRKFPTPPPEQSAPRISAKTKKLFLSTASGLVELSAGEPSAAKFQRRNCTENDERSLNVIENTGCRHGITGNVLDKTGS